MRIKRMNDLAMKGRVWIIIIIAILIFLTFVVLLYGMMVYRTKKVVQREKAVISKVIDSVNDGTDFHKKYISSSDVSRIKPFISKNYEICLYDIDFGLSEYIIVFDKKFKIALEFDEIEGDYYIWIIGIDWYDNNKE